ncbi:MAG: hypothetical protein ABIS84_04805 [Arachnia sp.]
MVVAIAVLGVAAWAGTGRLGEMPEPVVDRPKAYIPDGAVDAAFLEAVRIPRAVTGYHRGQVDDFLAAHASGSAEGSEVAFDVVRGGYDMQAVDEVLTRLAPVPVLGAPEADDAMHETREELATMMSDVAAGDGEPAGPAESTSTDAHQFFPDDSGHETDDSFRRDGDEKGSTGELPAP